MHTIKLLFFATFRDRAGTRETSLQIPIGASVAEMKKLVREKFPNLPVDEGSIIVAVNKDFAFDEDPIPEQAEVALFPPVSGGGQEKGPDLTHVGVQEGEIDLNAILERITFPTTGAACFFTGMVRAVTNRGNAHTTEYLEYESFEQMAADKMRQVADEIRREWPLVEGIAIIQRIGHLTPGTPTVMIACSAGHRDSGVFEAARYGIDRLKQIVPVWKKEVGPDGEIWVEGEYVPQPGE